MPDRKVFEAEVKFISFGLCCFKVFTRFFIEMQIIEWCWCMHHFFTECPIIIVELLKNHLISWKLMTDKCLLIIALNKQFTYLDSLIHRQSTFHITLSFYFLIQVLIIKWFSVIYYLQKKDLLSVPSTFRPWRNRLSGKDLSE